MYYLLFSLSFCRFDSRVIPCIAIKSIWFFVAFAMEEIISWKNSHDENILARGLSESFIWIGRMVYLQAVGDSLGECSVP
jgi:hypothetical protein